MKKTLLGDRKLAYDIPKGSGSDWRTGFTVRSLSLRPEGRVLTHMEVDVSVERTIRQKSPILAR
jgi:hypothetical protein